MLTLFKTNFLLIAGVLLVQCQTLNVSGDHNVVSDARFEGGQVELDVTISLDPSSFRDLFGEETEISNPSVDQLNDLADLLYSDDLNLNSEEIEALKKQLNDCRNPTKTCKIVAEGVASIVESYGGKKAPESPVFGPYSHGAISVSFSPPKCSLGVVTGATLELAMSESIEGCRAAGGTQCSLLVSWTNECVAVAFAHPCQLYHAVGKDPSDLKQRVLARCQELHEECFFNDQASFCTLHEGTRP